MIELGLLAGALACGQAYRMTHYSAGGVKTPSAGKLGAMGKLKVMLTGLNIPKPTDAETPADYGLRYETRGFRGAFGIRLESWYVPVPAQRGLVLMFHGYAASKGKLLPAAAGLSRLGFGVLMVDFFGSGGSGGSRTSIGYHEALDVKSAARFASRELGAGDPIVYGVSMGAAAALRAAHAYRLRPKAMILEAPFGRLLSTVGSRCRALGVPSFPLAHLLVLLGGAGCGFNGFRHDPIRYAQAIRCPTLLMAGTEDDWVPAEETRAIFEALNGPKTLELFPGVGHRLLAKERPSQWRAAAARFLDRAGA